MEEKKENYVYPAMMTKENGLYQLSFVDFPDAPLVEAETVDEVIHEAQECLALEIMDAESRKEKLPDPTTDVDHAVFVHVWMPYFRNASKEIYVKKNVTIPQWLDILAKENKVNYSAALVKGIKLALGIEH